jgi:hypothetical protein
LDNLYYRRWLATRDDGTKVVVETYTQHAEVRSADGKPAKLLHPSISVSTEIKPRKARK